MQKIWNLGSFETLAAQITNGRLDHTALAVLVFDDVLNKPRERLEIEDKLQKDREVESEREIYREVDRDRGLSH